MDARARFDTRMILRLSAQHLWFLREEAKRVHPVEACALLFGGLTDREAIVTRVVVMPNILRSTVRFEIDPQAFYKAFMQARKDGMEFVGFFHSHPALARPSAVDLRYMRLWGDAVWLVLSQTDGGMGAFRMRTGRVEELTIKVE